MGLVLADYTGGSDESDNRSGPRRRQACVRCDDADEKDRRRCNRGGTPRLRLHLRSARPARGVRDRALREQGGHLAAPSALASPSPPPVQYPFSWLTHWLSSSLSHFSKELVRNAH